MPTDILMVITYRLDHGHAYKAAHLDSISCRNGTMDVAPPINNVYQLRIVQPGLTAGAVMEYNIRY